MKKVSLLVLLFVVVGISSCDFSAEYAKFDGLNSPHKIELINCDGSVTKSWTSVGKVRSEMESDGYYFQEQETGKLIEVSGHLVITQL